MWISGNLVVFMKSCANHNENCNENCNENHYILGWPSDCTLWMTRSKWVICVEAVVFKDFSWFSYENPKTTTFHENCLFSYENHWFSWKPIVFTWKSPVFKSNKMRFRAITKYRSFVYNERPECRHTQRFLNVQNICTAHKPC